MSPGELSWTPAAAPADLDAKLSGVSDILVLVCQECGADRQWVIDIRTGRGLGIYCGVCGLVPPGEIGEWLDYWRNWSAEEIQALDDAVRTWAEGEPPAS